MIGLSHLPEEEGAVRLRGLGALKLPQTVVMMVVVKNSSSMHFEFRKPPMPSAVLYVNYSVTE